MIHFNINEKQFTIAEGWEDLTLRQFMDMALIKADEECTDLDRFIKCLSICANDNDLEKELNNLSIDDFKLVQEQFLWLGQEPPKNKKKNQINSFSITNQNGNMENWMIKTDFQKLTVGEMLDLESLLKDKRHGLTQLELAFGLLFRQLDENSEPMPWDYGRMDYIIHELSTQVKMMDINDTISFFLLGGTNSTTSTSAISFTPIVKKKPKKTQISSSATKKENISKKMHSTTGRGIASLTD